MVNIFLFVIINVIIFVEYIFFFVLFEKVNVLFDVVNYLYCGLFNWDYGIDEVILECDGVIFNEFVMLEVNSDYVLNVVI